MKCNKCGAEIKDTMKFCNKCGAKVTPNIPKVEQTQIKTNPSQHAESTSTATTPKAVDANRVVEPTKVTEPPNAEKTVPVETTVVNAPSPESQPVVKPVENPKSVKEEKPVAPLKPKNNIIAGLLAIALGYLGIQWFYLGKPLRAIIYIVAYLIFPFTWVISIIEGVFFLFAKSESFDKYRSFHF